MTVGSLVIMQEQVRTIAQIPQMIRHVENGGLWDASSSLIQIVRFEDGETMIHDGHHRCISTYLGGRDQFYPSEYEISDWKYADYMRISFRLGYVTPHDPRYEVRLPDFGKFKANALDLMKYDLGKAIEYIKDNKRLYARSRTKWRLFELADKISYRLHIHESTLL